MFTLLNTDNKARCGKLKTAHGEIKSPFFMTIATCGSVKGLRPEDVKKAGAQIVLGNTYHLHLRPGEDIVNKAGGLHNFMNWDKPILTDSGGFQVFSLAKLRKITERGVIFNSHIDGKKIFLTPEDSIRIQEKSAPQEAAASDRSFILGHPCKPVIRITRSFARRVAENMAKHGKLQSLGRFGWGASDCRETARTVVASRTTSFSLQARIPEPGLPHCSFAHRTQRSSL